MFVGGRRWAAATCGNDADRCVSAQVQRTLRRYLQDLSRIFAFYARLDASGSGPVRGDAMSFKGTVLRPRRCAALTFTAPPTSVAAGLPPAAFQQFARDCDLPDRLLTQNALKTLFIQAQLVRTPHRCTARLRRGR